MNIKPQACSSGPLPRGEIFLKCGEIVGNHQRLQVIDIDLWLCYP